MPHDAFWRRFHTPRKSESFQRTDAYICAPKICISTLVVHRIGCTPCLPHTSVMRVQDLECGQGGLGLGSCFQVFCPNVSKTLMLGQTKARYLEASSPHPVLRYSQFSWKGGVPQCMIRMRPPQSGQNFHLPCPFPFPLFPCPACGQRATSLLKQKFVNLFLRLTSFPPWGGAFVTGSRHHGGWGEQWPW